MEPAELRQLLNEGIRAVRAGDKARGRELLLKVVEADERMEPAWLWLAAVLENPADQMVALENALTLNPANEPVRQRLNQLRAEHGLTPSALPVAPPPTIPPPTPASAPALAPEPASPVAASSMAAYSAVDPDDDPLQCPYCGQPATELEDRCPHCRRSLLVSRGWSGKDFLYFILLALGLNLQGAVLQILLPLALMVLGSNLGFLTQLLVDSGFGNGLRDVPLAILILRPILLGVPLVMFLYDLPYAFAVVTVVSALDVAANGLGYSRGLAPPTPATWNGGLSALVLVIALIAQLSQSTARKRVYTQLDVNVYGAHGYYQRGREYQQKGLWALAARHWQKALSLEPRWPELYKDLGAAQARLGRYDKALRTLAEGARRAPQDADFTRLISEVHQQAAKPSQR